MRRYDILAAVPGSPSARRLVDRVVHVVAFLFRPVVCASARNNILFAVFAVWSSLFVSSAPKSQLTTGVTSADGVVTGGNRR